MRQRFSQIKLLILDVDGVLTDGKIWLSPQGEELKAFHVHDGVGIKQLQKENIEVAVITGRSSPAVSIRMRELNIKHVYLGQQEKYQAYCELLDKTNCAPHQVAMMGDDLPDLDIMKHVGVKITVADACDTVKKQADYITQRKGGDAAVREACDLILSFKQETVGAI
ncbi:MAG: HAD-IIIA family hydrolase [Gammaproteobacteria bacterium]|nr:HAD-IIIA family hydrolase [Gammaproteobacteria bacterium]MCH9745046.1 HAD-IIIA family hydrolase [Gammaproteobacteria bacterium]